MSTLAGTVIQKGMPMCVTAMMSDRLAVLANIAPIVLLVEKYMPWGSKPSRIVMSLLVSL